MNALLTDDPNGVIGAPKSANAARFAVLVLLRQHLAGHVSRTDWPLLVAEAKADIEGTVARYRVAIRAREPLVRRLVALRAWNLRVQGRDEGLGASDKAR